MKPLFVTNISGQRVRLNPMNMIGWAGTEVSIGNGKVVMGSAVALPDGPRQVRESPEQLDWLFEQATDGWMRPIVTRADLERFMGELKAREAGEDPLAAGPAPEDDPPPPARVPREAREGF